MVYVCIGLYNGCETGGCDFNGGNNTRNVVSREHERNMVWWTREGGGGGMVASCISNKLVTCWRWHCVAVATDRSSSDSIVVEITM